MRSCRSFLVCCVIAVSLCATLAVPATVQAATVFTNLSGTIASNLPVGITGADWTYGAQQFNSGNNTLVTDVTLYLARAAGTVTGNYNVEVWSNVSNLPGALVGSIATAQDPSGVTTSGPQTVNFSGNVAVSPNTAYWIVMNMANNASQLQWQYTNDSPTSPGFVGVAGTSLLVSADQTDSFTTPAGITDGRLMMSVVAVPEPATTSLLAAAGVVAGIGIVRRRRR